MEDYILSSLLDEYSRRVLVSTMPEGKTVREISAEQAVPLSTCYRLAGMLADQATLVIESFAKEKSRKCAVYRNPYRAIEISLHSRGISVSAELDPDVNERTRYRKWSCLTRTDETRTSEASTL